MNPEDLTLEATHSQLAPSFASDGDKDGDRSLDRRHRGPRRRAISHDPLCPIQRETWCIWPGDKCDRCALIVRVRDEALDAAREAVEAVPHWIDTEIALALPWSVRGEKWIAKDLALNAINALKEKP